MSKSKNVDQKGRTKWKRFTALDHSLMASAAYRALSPSARALLFDFAMMENGRNNGELFLSVRDAADRLGVADLKSARLAIAELITFGFIEETQTARFASKASEGSRARCWRLTWQAVQSRQGPTHEYLSCQPDPNSVRDRRAHKRMLRGQAALKRWKREKPKGEETTTLTPKRVEETNTAKGANMPKNDRRVLQSTTPLPANPQKTVDQLCSGNHLTYSCQVEGQSGGSETPSNTPEISGAEKSAVPPVTSAALAHARRIGAIQ